MTMELKNLQSTYDYLKGRSSSECRQLLANVLPNVESVLPVVYGDAPLSDFGLPTEGAIADELKKVVQKIRSVLKERATKKQRRSKMLYDDSLHDALQTYYEMLLSNASTWTKRRLNTSGLTDVKNLSPWLEGRYVGFSRLLPEGTRVAVEIDDILSKLLEKLKLLHRERWIQSEGCQTTGKTETRMFAQSKLEALISSLSGRAKNILENNGLDSIDMLMPWLNGEQSNFMAINHCGVTISAELVAMVAELKAYIDSLEGDGSGGVAVSPSNVPATDSEPELSPEVIVSNEERYSAMVGTLSVRALNVMRRNGLTSEENFRKYVVSNKFNFINLDWCGERTAEELRNFAKDVYRKGDSVYESRSTPFDKDVLGRLQIMVNDFVADKSSRTQTQLSSRGLDKIDMIIPYILNPAKDHPFGNLSQTGIDFSDLVSFLRTFLVSTALEGESVLSDSELPLSVNAGYNAEERAFIRGFRDRHGHWPLFYMVQRYFMHSNYSGDVVFASLFGLRGQAPLSADEASKKMGYSRVTIEQKMSSVAGSLSYELRSLVGNDDWHRYSFLRRPCMLLDPAQSDPDVAKTVSDEQLEPSLNIIAAVAKIFGSRVIFVDAHSLRTSSLAFPQTTVRIIAKPPLDGFLFRAAFKDMLDATSMQRDTPLVVDVRSRFVGDSLYRTHREPLDDEQQSALVDLLGQCFARLFGAKYSDGVAVFPPNKAAYRDELYWMLKAAGTRLHIDEIVRRFGEQHPEMKSLTAAQICYYLKTDLRFKSIGKSSFWDLVDRSRTASSIRQMAIDTVAWSEGAIGIEELVESILARRFDSNVASIRSIVRKCIATGELRYVEGKLYLKDKKTS